MRILICPVYEFLSQPGADSTFLWNRDLVKQAAKRGWFSYFVTPTTEAEDGLTERVERLVPGITVGRAAGEAMLPLGVAERYMDPLAYPIDAIVTNNPFLGLVLRQFFEGLTHGLVKIPIIVWNVGLKFIDSDEVPTLSREDLAAHALGYCVNENIMPSVYSMERCRDTVTALCGSSMALRYEQRNTVLYAAADCDLIDKVAAPKFDKFSLYYGGRFTATKMGERAVEQYIRFVMGGREADVYVTYAGAARRLSQTLKRLGGQKVVQAMTNVSWQDALKLMTRCHATVFWQSLKLTPSACFEQLYAGLVVLIRRTGVEDEFLPEGYPFLFSTPEECATMLRWVHENYDEARAQVAHVPAFIRDRFDRPTGMNKVLDFVERVVAERYQAAQKTGDRDDTRAAIGKAIRAVGTPCRYLDLAQALQRLKPNLVIKELSNTRGQFLMHLTQNLLPDEFVDDCEAPEPRYVEADALEK